ncbi:toxin [Sulfurimonas sediminis]|uniref:Toxin n=1 Tax=Sulfurimonas sediminis TaxID=2590020 RepID=A0A7M1B1Q9_9BACT|nr:toxin [Sulfurimonas sediminis]QOP42658.1 toxin [Sulfurimonas sediminis]
MNFKWNIEKNKLLKAERGVCFEDVVTQIHEDKVLDIVKHPNTDKYPHQKMYIVCLQNYVHMVPYVKENDEIFFKTIVPSRKMNKLYKGACNENG